MVLVEEPKRRLQLAELLLRVTPAGIAHAVEVVGDGGHRGLLEAVEALEGLEVLDEAGGELSGHGGVLSAQPGVVLRLRGCG